MKINILYEIYIYNTNDIIIYNNMNESLDLHL